MTTIDVPVIEDTRQTVEEASIKTGKDKEIDFSLETPKKYSPTELF